MDKRYTNPDNDPRGPWTSSDFTVKTASEAYMYDIVTPSGRVVRPTSSRSWATSEENYLALRADNRIWFGAKGNNVPRIKTFLSEVQKGTVCKTIWYRTEVGDTQEGTRDLKSVFGKAGMFTNPKPIRLINRILDIASQNISIVLDFLQEAALQVMHYSSIMQSMLIASDNLFCAPIMKTIFVETLRMKESNELLLTKGTMPV